MVEPVLGQCYLRVASFPHITSMMVILAMTLEIMSSNSVFSAALFGQDQPQGLHITALIPEFDQVLGLLFRENGSELVDGLVIPEYSFCCAQALLAIREGSPDAAMALLRPNGLPAKHQDSSKLRVDVQMRVVKNSTFNPDLKDAVIVEGDRDDVGTKGGLAAGDASEAMYTLWITYS